MLFLSREPGVVGDVGVYVGAVELVFGEEVEGLFEGGAFVGGAEAACGHGGGGGGGGGGSCATVVGGDGGAMGRLPIEVHLLVRVAKEEEDGCLGDVASLSMSSVCPVL